MYRDGNEVYKLIYLDSYIRIMGLLGAALDGGMVGRRWQGDGWNLCKNRHDKHNNQLTISSFHIDNHY